MPADLSAYAAILIMAGVTLGTRLMGAAIMRQVADSGRVKGFLDALSVSVIAAIVATVVAQHGLREAMAVTLAGLVMLALRSKVSAMLAGMAVAAVWTALAS